MLECYFIRPETLDRIRACWLADAIQTYVAWLTGQSDSSRCVIRRMPLFMRFGDFAQKRGVTRVEDLHSHLDGFVRYSLRHRAKPCGSKASRRVFIQGIRGSIELFLRVAKAELVPAPPRKYPISVCAPRFFEDLRKERGLSPTTIAGYSFHLARFEQYVIARRLPVEAISPTFIDGFLAHQRVHFRARSMGPTCAALRNFLRYLFRTRTIRRDLSVIVDRPRTYQLSGIPRSISASEVQQTLATIDRRSIVGRRDYAMLLLLSVYGLRAREVAALTLDDVDWQSGVLHVRGRKAGHAATYPLITEVGEAVLDYLRHGRPETPDRRIFFCIMAPRAAVTHSVVSLRAMTHLRKAGITVSKPGSHTLRHSCAQRLVDADFSLKVIGDFLGHRNLSSTRIHSKVAIEALREVALGDGEVLL